MGVIVGIDLGTTNSCVAIVKDGRPKVIEDERGYNILPSCIAMKGRGRFVVGHGAKAVILTQPTETLYAVKRLIGRKFQSPEVQETSRHVSYEILEGEAGGVLLRMGDIEVTPVEASSIILKAVKEIAEKAVGEPVTDAVVTVPANFTHAQRKATMEAGEKAGLNVLRLLNEPTAAALAYGFKKDIHKKICVFDLGGGTFDVSILEVGDGVYEILGTAGNTFLGGDDFDYRIVSWLSDQFIARSGVDPRQDREALQRLKDAAERAKCELSFVDRTPILIPRLAGEHNLELDLSREHLESMVQDLINECVKITDQALRTANVSIEDLDEIILVGGMTRMPKIQETIRIFFGMNPCKGVHPEEVVAIGAAVHGYSLESETQSTLLLDVTPHSLGVDTAGGFFKPIIDRNTTVPCSECRTFTTVKDGQAEVRIIVRQGESKLASENDLLGEFTLAGIREAEKMVPRIDVTFKVDANGILHVTAVDRDTTESQAIEIRDYIRQATGEEPKAVTLAREDLQAAAAGAGGDAPKAAGADADAGSGGGAFFGRLAKLAGFGKGKKKEKGAEKAAPMDPTALEARSEDRLALQSRPDDQLAVQARSADELALARRGGSDADEGGRATEDFAVQERIKGEPDDDIAADLRRAVGAGARGGSAADGLDPHAIKPRDPDAPKAAPAGGGKGKAAATAAAASTGSAAPAPSRAPGPPAKAPAGKAPAGKAPPASAPSARAMATGAGSSDEIVPLPDEEDARAPAPVDPVFDPFGVAPRQTTGASPFGRGLAVGQDVLDLDEVELDKLDPFGVAPRSDEKAAAKAAPEVKHSSKAAPPPPPKSAAKAAAAAPAPAPQAFPAAAESPGPAAPAATSQPGTRVDRRPARLRIAYKKASTFVQEYQKNLKRGGSFIKTQKPLDVGRDCVLHLTVPGWAEPLEIKGSVVWSSKGVDILAGQEEGMGIKYDADDAAGLEQLKSALNHLQAGT